MSFFNMFTPKAIDNAVDGIYNSVDMAFYTDEEKAKAVQKAVDTKLKMLPLYEPFKLAQRYMAFAFTVNFILAFWVCVLIWMFGTKEQVTEFLGIVSTFQLGWIMLTIVAWYYGGGFVESAKKSIK